MFYFDATCPWLLREFKSIEIDRHQPCNNMDGEPRNGAILQGGGHMAPPSCGIGLKGWALKKRQQQRYKGR